MDATPIAQVNCLWSFLAVMPGVISRRLVDSPSRAIAMSSKSSHPTQLRRIDGNSLRAGGAVGMLIAALLLYGVPYFLMHTFSVNVRPAWGFGDFSFVFCAVGVALGMFFGRKITRTRF
jgi:hypothetical protein